ncbi:DivIVA domain-containing protein [Mycoplasmopsis columbinasalis]|uniref:DivIVA protein n=1 Tax=Mycoplasmopsis columbinasalis TaxID=114880 RepID=A0A449BAD4_9BACT|nr:DivIVA domain-containing protein [Mycoplasmopsis columbinasalis]VEU78163.1 DivIVA protein [Mycoplasmopsis columbinasalis]
MNEISVVEKIKTKKFHRELNGYITFEVDNFLEELVVDFENQKANEQKQIELLNSQIANKNKIIGQLEKEILELKIKLGCHE